MTRLKYTILAGILFFGLGSGTIMLLFQKVIFNQSLHIQGIIITYILHIASGIVIANFLYTIKNQEKKDYN